MWTLSDITAVVTCFESKHWLHRCLESIRREGPISIILVDDGSQECSCADLAQRYDSITHIKRANGGHPAALNTGIAQVQTALTAFLDDDDEWIPGKAHRQITLLNTTECDVVTGRVRNVTIRNGVTVHQFESPPARILGSSTFRTDALRAVGAFDEHVPMHSVVDWWSRAQAAGISRCADDEVALIRRIHGENLGIRNRAAGNRDLLQHLRSHLQRRNI